MNWAFPRIFIPQAVLDEWSVGEHILLNDDVLTLEPSGWRYRITPAIHVEKLASGADRRSIVGKVKREEELTKEGAEVYLGSVVWGEDAYEGVPGFLGERLAAEDGKDVDVLAQFVLEKM